MLGKLDNAEIEAVLSSQVVGRIGCHADNLTYVVPVSYAYDGKYVYVHTRNGMKVDMMRRNPEVCFEVDEMKNMANWRSVIAWGTFEELGHDEERSAALDVLLKRILPIISSETTHLSSHWPFRPDNLDEIGGIVFRIELKNKTGRFERSDSAEPYVV